MVASDAGWAVLACVRLANGEVEFWSAFASVPRHEMPGGAWNLVEKAVCFIASTKKDGSAAAVRDENSETDVLTRGTDASGYVTAAGDELNCFTAAGRTTGMTVHHLTGA